MINALFFLFVADGRHGIVRVDRVPLACKLVDLPCMIESLKTVDKKTFYKTADVCQVNHAVAFNVGCHLYGICLG